MERGGKEGECPSISGEMWKWWESPVPGGGYLIMDIIHW